MSESIARVSSMSQITVPAEVRRRLGVGPSDTIAFVAGNDGTIEARVPRYDLESIIGSIPELPGASDDLDAEIADAMAAEIDRLGRRTM
jgi:AbrB family looped-hinge helix DNA binding protein